MGEGHPRSTVAPCAHSVGGMVPELDQTHLNAARRQPDSNTVLPALQRRQNADVWITFGMDGTQVGHRLREAYTLRGHQVRKHDAAGTGDALPTVHEDHILLLCQGRTDELDGAEHLRMEFCPIEEHVVPQTETEVHGRVCLAAKVLRRPAAVDNVGHLMSRQQLT